MNVELEPGELQQLVNILANCKGFSWAEINTILLKLAQLQAQPQEPPRAFAPPREKQQVDGVDRAN